MCEQALTSLPEVNKRKGKWNKEAGRPTVSVCSTAAKGGFFPLALCTQTALSMTLYPKLLPWKKKLWDKTAYMEKHAYRTQGPSGICLNAGSSWWLLIMADANFRHKRQGCHPWSPFSWMYGTLCSVIYTLCLIELAMYRLQFLELEVASFGLRH